MNRSRRKSKDNIIESSSRCNKRRAILATPGVAAAAVGASVEASPPVVQPQVALQHQQRHRGVRPSMLSPSLSRPAPGIKLRRIIKNAIENHPQRKLQCAAARTNDEITAFLNTQAMWQRDVQEAERDWSKAIGVALPIDPPYRNSACSWKKESESSIACCRHRWGRNPWCSFPDPNPHNDMFSAPGCEGGSVFLWSHGFLQ